MGQVNKQAVSDEEISAVESIEIVISAGMIREQFSEVLTGKGTCEEDGNCDV